MSHRISDWIDSALFLRDPRLYSVYRLQKDLKLINSQCSTKDNPRLTGQNVKAMKR